MGPTASAQVNYGNFSGDTVTYHDVTEMTTSAGDPEPLLRAPTIHGDVLDFDPAGFHATDDGGGADETSVRVDAELLSQRGSAIRTIRVQASGDHSLLANDSTDIAEIFYELELASITVHDVDGSPLRSPVALAPAAIFAMDSLPSAAGHLDPWILVLHYDVDTALDQAGVLYSEGATRLVIELWNTLDATGDPETIASIAEKDFTLQASPVPEPDTRVALVCAVTMLAALLAIRSPQGRRPFR